MNDTLNDLSPSRRYGPWADGLDPGERLARLRALRALTRVLLGPRGATLATLLHMAETDDDALKQAADALDAIAPVDLRRVLSSYAALGRSVAPARRTGGVQGFRLSSVTGTALPAAPRQGWPVPVPPRLAVA